MYTCIQKKEEETKAVFFFCCFALTSRSRLKKKHSVLTFTPRSCTSVIIYHYIKTLTQAVTWPETRTKDSGI